MWYVRFLLVDIGPGLVPKLRHFERTFPGTGTFLRRSPENYPRTHSEHVPNPVFISFLRCTLVLSVHRVTSHGNEIQNEAITAGCASKAVWYGTVTDADRVALLIGQGWGFWITAACACEVGTHSFDVGMSW
jgi:hypothetical protein